ncbi:MAG: hypothetical protein LBB84_00815 [Tannerellaceae bacterium]|jgi:hypothetical protein|nr:hypothetical protein [Tannerellaceae bacterium]
MKDYIPHKESVLALWSANFTAQVVANATAWEIPTQEITALQTANADFVTLHAQANNPEKTSIIVAEKNAAREALVAKIRRLVGFRLKNPVVTNADRIALGLRVRDSKPSHIPAPKSRPEIAIVVLDVCRLKILFHDINSDHKAKPYGVHGALLAYAVLDAPPASPNALTRTRMATRTPYTLEFREEERGKTVYIATCWENKKGEKGPWSEIGKAIVP